MPNIPQQYPQMVRIRNDDDKVFQQKYAGQRYNLVPGAETFIPWDAACLWFGHPFAVDVPGDKRKRYRSDELRRLFVKYGVYERHDEAGSKFPKVSVWDITNGERIITVVDDPEGRELNPAAISQADNEGLQAQLKAMQEQMAMVQAQLAAQQANGGAVPSDVTEQGNRPEITDDDRVIDDGGLADLPSDTPTRPKAVAKTS